MCIKCVKEGKMSQEEYDKEAVEGKELTKQIQALLQGKDEVIVLNTILSVLINISIDLEVAPMTILLALAQGFNEAAVKIGVEKGKEIRH